MLGIQRHSLFHTKPMEGSWHVYSFPAVSHTAYSVLLLISLETELSSDILTPLKQQQR